MSQLSRFRVYVPRLGGEVRFRRLLPELIRALECRATRRNQLDLNKFQMLKFRYAVAEPQLTAPEVERIFHNDNLGPSVALVLDQIDRASDCEPRVHFDARIPRGHRAAIRAAALIADVRRRTARPRCGARLHLGRERRLRRNHRRYGSRRASGIRTGQDPGEEGEADQPPGTTPARGATEVQAS